MFIGGLSWQTSAEGLREYFSKFGDVTEVMVMKDPTTRRSRSVALVGVSTFKSVENWVGVTEGHVSTAIKRSVNLAKIMPLGNE